MSTEPHPLRKAVHTALRQYDNLTLLERNALTSLYALWPLPADHWHQSLSAPRKGIALRRLLDNALAQLAERLPADHAFLVEKYIHKTSNLDLQQTQILSKANLQRRRNDALDALATEIAVLDTIATENARRRLTTQTVFLPGYAPDTIVGLDTLLDTFLGYLRQRLRQPRTPILITGLGGIGKTTLVDTGLRLWFLQEAPPIAGVLYVRVATGDLQRTGVSSEILTTILVQLGVQLNTPLVDPLAPTAGLTRLTALLAARYQSSGQRYVIVLDDIESAGEHAIGVQIAQAVSGMALVVLASRHAPELPTVRGAVVRVQELSKAASARLVRVVRATADPPLPPLTPDETKQIVKTVGGHPLALGLVVAQVGLGRLTLDDVLEGLVGAGGLAERLYDHIYERSWALLSSFAQKVLEWFTNFPTSGVTLEGLEALKIRAGDTATTRMIEQAMGELLTLNLLQRTTQPHVGFALHRLTYQFVEYKTARRGSGYDLPDAPSDDDDDTIFFADDDE